MGAHGKHDAPYDDNGQDKIHECPGSDDNQTIADFLIEEGFLI